MNLENLTQEASDESLFLDDIRRVTANWTFRFGGYYYQIASDSREKDIRGHTVIVRKNKDGTASLYRHDGAALSFDVFDRNPFERKKSTNKKSHLTARLVYTYRRRQ